MDVYCEVCGIVTVVSGGASVGRKLECWVCGASLQASAPEAKGALAPAVGDAPASTEARSSGPPPSPLRRPSQPCVVRDDDDPTMIDLRAIALKSFLSKVTATRATSAGPAAGSPAGASARPIAGGTPAAPATGVKVELGFGTEGAGGRAGAPTVNPGLGAQGPEGRRDEPTLEVDARPSVDDVLRVYDSLAPVHAPAADARTRRVLRMLAKGAAVVLVLGAVAALCIGALTRRPALLSLGVAERGAGLTWRAARAIGRSPGSPPAPGSLPAQGAPAVPPSPPARGAPAAVAASAPHAGKGRRVEGAASAESRIGSALSSPTETPAARGSAARARVASAQRAPASSRVSAAARLRDGSQPTQPAPVGTAEAPVPPRATSLFEAMAAAVAGDAPAAPAAPASSAPQPKRDEGE